MSLRLGRAQYVAIHGPTAGDRIRLADTALWARVEQDLTVPGEECVFGGGKTLRDGQAQASGVPAAQALDLVITGAVIVDWTGIFKADIGIKHGRIVGLGKAGNPDTMDGVTPGLVVGVTTEVLSGEHHLVTAGGIDSHIHFICPQQVQVALSSGITTSSAAAPARRRAPTPPPARRLPTPCG